MLLNKNWFTWQEVQLVAVPLHYVQFIEQGKQFIDFLVIDKKWPLLQIVQLPKPKQ